MDKEKKEALNKAIAQIEKAYGKGSIMTLGENSKLEIETIPTGVLSLDVALGVGGLPRGRIIEIFGPESSGKTTLTLHILAATQKIGGVVAFIDAEHALDPQYAKAIGVDIDNLMISQPDTGEQALEIAEALVRSNVVDLIIVDSVAALVPKAEIDGLMGDSHVGLQARLMSQALRKLTGAINKSKACLVFINQLRQKIGVVYGNPETTTGGRALKFFSSVRIDIRKGEAIKKGEELIGNKTKVKIVKNKVAAPFKNTEFDIIFGEGISLIGDLLDVASSLGIVEKSGAWYSYNDHRLGQGREKSKIFLEENLDILNEIDKKVRESLKNKGNNKISDDIEIEVVKEKDSEGFEEL